QLGGGALARGNHRHALLQRPLHPARRVPAHDHRRHRRPAIATEERFRFVPVTADTGPAIRRLADLAPRTLALMHGPTFVGEPRAPLTALAEYYDTRLRRSMTP